MKGTAVSFRDNLQSLRAEKNMTQEQLAMLLGVSRQSVTKWEAEKSYPEMDKLLKLCDIFECSLDDLVKGDLTERGGSQEPPVVSSLPVDVCGYDDHQRMMAWKVPTGISLILVGVALAFLSQATGVAASWGDGVFVLIVLVGVAVGLGFIIPSGMAHSAFVKSHPYIEDFYSEEDRAQARKSFSVGFVAGISLIFVGVGCLMILGERSEYFALFLLMLFIALGVWSIVRYGMLLGRTNVAEYNKSVADELEMEDIINAQIDEARRKALIDQKQRSKKLGAVCGTIMIVATIIGLLLLFVPILSSSNPDSFEVEGTPASWFWLAWPIGGLVCGVVWLLWDAFSKDK